MTFYAPDNQAFPAMNLARHAARRKGNVGAVLNGANEAAVGRFLADELPFWKIPQLVEQAMEQVPYQAQPTLDNILASDRAARQAVASLAAAR